jgi:hypothetical protein
MLLPGHASHGIVSWMIWTLTTWLTEFAQYQESETLLRMPFPPLTETGHLETDVLIVGGGNS